MNLQSAANGFSSIPILVSVFVALVAGAATGFRRGWKVSLLLACLGVPFAASVILPEPPWLVFREALLKLLGSVLVAALAWSLTAALHHAASRLNGDAGEAADPSRAARFLGWGSSAIVAVAVPTAVAALFSHWAVDGLGARCTRRRCSRSPASRRCSSGGAQVFGFSRRARYAASRSRC